MNKKQFSSKQEHLIASHLDWRVIAGSGARLTSVGDIMSDDWLGECKTHVSSGHPITFDRKVWAKLRDESATRFKHPALFVDDGSQLITHTWCMFPISTFDLSEHITEPYAKSIQQNITFKYDDLDPYTIHTCSYNNMNVGITSLTTFQSLLN